MSDPMTPERLAEIREEIDLGTGVLSGETATELLDEVDRLRERMAVVAAFCAARAEYITAINNCHPDNAHDYQRWQGHAEGRRQLSEQLGLPVGWPTGYVRDGDDRG